MTIVVYCFYMIMAFLKQKPLNYSTCEKYLLWNNDCSINKGLIILKWAKIMTLTSNKIRGILIRF